jgi:hypothetical protein
MKLNKGYLASEPGVNPSDFSLSDPSDFRIELNKTLENQVENAFVAESQDTFSHWYGDANSYRVTGGTVPEPTTGLLLGLAMTYVALKRRENRVSPPICF